MLKEKTKIFKALSDPSRLRILQILCCKKLCVCEITCALKLATSTVSRHLSILRDAGFILEEKEGKWIYYYLNPSPSDSRVTSILNSIDFWISDEEMILSDKKNAQISDRKSSCCK